MSPIRSLSPYDLEALIRGRIPVADFMQLHVARLQSDSVVLTAPLEPNRNVHGTLFGGSGTAIALVAAWSLVYARMQAEGLLAPLVVAQQTTRYFRPITGAVQALATFEGAGAWDAFTGALGQGRRARVGVVVELRPSGPGALGDVAARVDALFAAVPGAESPQPHGTSA